MKNNNQRKQSNRKTIRIAAGVVGLLVVLLGGFFFYQNWRKEQLAKERKNEVETLVDDYLSALTEQRFKEYVDVLYLESIETKGYTDEELSERYASVFQTIGVETIEVTSHEILYNEETDDYSFKYTTDMSTVLGNTGEMDYQADIKETEESKAVVWNHSLFFPGMEKGDTVSLSYSEPDRGSIYDRDGNMLAGLGDAYEAGLYPKVLGDGTERDERLKNISKTFDVSSEQLLELLDQNWVNEESFVPFKTVDVGETPEVTGVLYQKITDRIYPLGEAAAHLTGYVGEVSAEDIENDPTLKTGQIIGKAGLEYRFDQELRGEPGGEITLVNDQGETKKVLVEQEKIDGRSLSLTISSEIQTKLFEAFESEPGSASLMDPRSGELLSLVSSPSYDPQSFARGISTEDYNAYNNDKDQPFLNRFTARYAPGSTFKILTSLVLLESGTTTPDKKNTIEGLSWSPDIKEFGDRKITRVSDTVTEVDLSDALVYSDNIFFAMEALEMGSENFVEGMLQFPFGESLELPLAMEPAQPANDNTIDKPALLADTAYGQGEVLMNTIHQQTYFSPVLNKGTFVYPRLLLEETQLKTEPLISAENAERVRAYLVEAVNNPNGTSHVLDELNYQVGAKTGTAEIAGDDGNITNGFLYAFDEEDTSYSFVGQLEGQKSGDVIERFEPFLKSILPLIK
ncbi:penicillin-binding protein PBP4(5) [Alkalibacterium kapii]|uniref:Beta-lactamase n=1 Tax=Alkalibacterium kapii TaxID=426704 RepID=A0A511ARL1_9LACT|nr:penicillin-binding transpeptidase domain-containing protein [Alkalibacterium kapii]GEK90392.1 D-alanyl-D-alanine carboxypeptidase [Alkalibacterium kapii]